MPSRQISAPDRKPLQPPPGECPAFISRRRFLAATATGVAGTLAAPAIVTAKRKRAQNVVGTGDYRFELTHDFPKLPSRYSWQTTHNVALDKAGNLYVIHEGRKDLADHPSIFVFDASGKFIRAFGSQFQGGGHGLEVREDGGEEFLYVCAYQHVKSFAKLTLAGDTVWQRFAPMEAGVYAAGEDTNPQKIWGRDRFMPTNFAFLDDGGFLLADGYGSFWIHRYDKDANWLDKFGGPGDGEGTFDTPHGIWIDRRQGREQQIVVCDRAHHTLQTFTMEGQYIETLTGYGLPANIDTWENLLLVPELHARVTLLDEKNQVVARLGDDVTRVTSEQGIRNDRSRWLDGKFVHPHDACFGPNGEIYVAEWVQTGRVSRLIRV